MISVQDYLWYVDQALDQLSDILTELGDDLANQHLRTPGANSPYAVVTHCLGVMEWWGGQVVANRSVHRDRAAEFVASGPVAPLLDRVRAARVQLARDLEGVDLQAAPRGPIDDAEDAATPVGRTAGGVLLHVYEELSQHRGQVEVTRDVLLAAR